MILDLAYFHPPHRSELPAVMYHTALKPTEAALVFFSNQTRKCKVQKCRNAQVIIVVTFILALICVLKKLNTFFLHFRSTLKNHFNPRFGSVFRTNKNPTYFSRRLFRFADMYTSRVTNLSRYSLSHTFFPRRGVLPHEFRSLFNWRKWLSCEHFTCANKSCFRALSLSDFFHLNESFLCGKCGFWVNLVATGF